MFDICNHVAAVRGASSCCHILRYRKTSPPLDLIDQAVRFGSTLRTSPPLHVELWNPELDVYSLVTPAARLICPSERFCMLLNHLVRSRVFENTHGKANLPSECLLISLTTVVPHASDGNLQRYISCKKLPSGLTSTHSILTYSCVDRLTAYYKVTTLDTASPHYFLQ